MSESTTSAEAIADAPYKVLYDGNCNFCQDSVATLKRLDKHGLTEPTPLSEEVLKELKVNATMEECFAQMHIVSKSHELLVGYFAIVRLAKLFPETQFLAWIAEHLIPKQLGCMAYRFIARNRYKINKCKDGQCRLH